MNATELLASDHRVVEQLFQDLRDAGSEPGRTAMIVELVRMLSVHAAIEETHLYPVLRARVKDGGILADARLHEHRQMKVILNRLDKHAKNPLDDQVVDDLRALEAVVLHHVEHEEDEIFPMLSDKLSAEELTALGVELSRAKATSPTRPHPHQPPVNAVSGRISGAVDRTRDRLSGR